MIELYSPDNADFEHNGDMTLLPESASVHVILNGAWTASLTHPIDDEGRWKYIVEDAVVKLPSFNGNQLFRIKQKEKSDSGITVTMEPIFMDALGDCFLVDVRPTGKNGQEALNSMTAVNKKYSGTSNITTTATAYYEYMNLIEAINGDNENSFVNRWGGEILFDNYKVVIDKRVGGDYGVELRYGKNIPQDGFTEDVDLREVVTRIYPKAYNGYKMAGTGYVDSPLINSYPTIKAVTITFDDVKMEADAQEDDAEKGVIICKNQAELNTALKQRCQEQYEAGIDQPKVSIEADMILLSDTDQYQEYAVLETVLLGDTIHCHHERLDLTTEARVVELVYDAVLQKVSSVVLGDFTYNYFNGVSSSVNRIDQAIRPDGTVMADKIAGFINGAMASLTAQYNAAKKQDVLAILFENLDDSNSLYGALALGTQGLMISKRRTADGRSWDWTTAITAAGMIATYIVAGVLSDQKGLNYWNLDTGELRVVATEFSLAGKTIDQIAGEQVNDFASSVYDPEIAELQKQIDGKIETYYYDYAPTLNNVPASEWNTEAERLKHEGDLFYWKSKGYAYRFFKNGSTWSWQMVQDTDVTKALEAAAEAQDTADHKRRVFITTPVPPYDVGDLWTQGAAGDIMRCKTARASGSYLSSDWIKASKYTDDSAVTALNDALDQEEVFNRLTNHGQIQGIYMSGGKLYLNATYMQIGKITDKSGNNWWNLDTGELHAGKATFENISGTDGIRINGGRIRVVYDGDEIGYIGANNLSKDASKKGLVFDLEDDGDYMTWAYKKTASANVYTTVLTFARSGVSGFTGNALNAGCNLDMQNYKIQQAIIDGFNCSKSFQIPNNVDCNIYSDIDFHNWSLKNLKVENLSAIDGKGTWTGTIPIYYEKGGSYYTSTISVVDGLIVSAPKA
ncbi:Phage-related protein [uncultured Roseburia sp.]|uniref:Phage tail protein n=1 Tax=Brotonthovivens ammoniilytica TaxID=2981725 RepID=A0ABT2TPI8_9FIRM|nr:phage tail spike protein [Brotonthovivens ammoniilytica]MCU6763517.1 phage tail protein [Brotonthovivens ammoniilytica]SCJ23679.1 Phage-related protein [uncultured Roseburia sp.]